jgi:hypothetical protein
VADWPDDEKIMEVVRRVLADGTPATDEELTRIGLRQDSLDPDGFGWMRAAYQRREEFSYPREQWQDVFRSAGWADAVRAAVESGGVVAYHLLTDDGLRMIGIVDDQTTVLRTWQGVPRVAVMEGFWTEVLTRWKERHPAGAELRALCIDIGAPELTALGSDVAFRAALDRLWLASNCPAGGLTHLPSIRLAHTRMTLPAPQQAERILHLGDATNTLIGPWLEAAALDDLPQIEVQSLLGADTTVAEFRRLLASAPVVIASCHGLDNADLLGSALGLGTESLHMEDVAASDLASIDLLFIAACETGRGNSSDHEREALSFANASLVGGCRYVAAPVLPVDDLVSAVLVTEFAARTRVVSPPLAYHAAVGTIRQLSQDEFAARVAYMWEALRNSRLASRLPWPVRVIDKEVSSHIEKVSETQIWRELTFTLSGA